MTPSLEGWPIKVKEAPSPHEVIPGHILDLYCVELSNTTPFCENYTKLYFDAKHVEKGLNRRRNVWCLFFKKSALFS